MTERPEETSQKERRKHPRAKLGIPIEFKPAGATVASRAKTADLSLVGCYIEMSFTLPVGSKLDIVLWLGDKPMAAEAVVVTHHPQFGNGFEFLNMSQENQSKLAHFLKASETQSAEALEPNPSGALGTGN